MIRVSILYPNEEGARFDLRYYLEQHMPLSIRLLGAHPGFRGATVDRGVGGAVPGSAPAYIAMCHFLFSSIEDFMRAFNPHAAVLQQDIPRYTNVTPVIQFNDVVLAQ